MTVFNHMQASFLSVRTNKRQHHQDALESKEIPSPPGDVNFSPRGSSLSREAASWPPCKLLACFKLRLVSATKSGSSPVSYESHAATGAWPFCLRLQAGRERPMAIVHHGWR